MVLGASAVGTRNRLIRWLVLALAISLACPVLASSVDCSRIHDPVDQTLCASPQLLKLDSQLATAYAAALARSPSRAPDLQRDQGEWIGERNREVWWQLAAQREYPSLPDSPDKALAQFYQLRIAFLRSLDNPVATKDLPLARKLLASAATWPAGEGDALKAFQSTGLVVLPEQHDADSTSVDRLISTLAAVPNAALSAALKRFGDPYFTVVYLPSAGLGGAFTIEGTADCQYWVLFEKKGNGTVPVDSQVGEMSGSGCTRDDGSTGYLALINGHPVALNVTNYPAFLNITDLQWQRWLGGNQWSPATRIRLRFRYTLNIDNATHCLGPASHCASTEPVALDAVKQYLRNPWALPNRIHLTAGERTQFDRMLELAPDRKNWGYCTYPVWFPVRLNGKLVVGGITESHIGCHPEGALDVRFWGTRSDRKSWWFADHSVTVELGHLLTAALLPPSRNL